MKDNALYLEVDEDITSAIDKLSKSQPGSVQIVVPKRSTMLQSIINLKLLKKAAENSGKTLVLVTGDRIASDLAARVGLAVAPSIGAPPVITEAHVPEALKNHEEIIDADDPEPSALPVEPKVTASKKPLIKRLPVTDGPPPALEAATTALGTAEITGDSGTSPVVADVPKKTSTKVPNFARLQRRVMWVGLAALLVAGYLGAMYLLTSAKVVLYATGTRVSIDTTFSVDRSLKSTDQAKAVMAGQLVSISKDLTGPFVPTGKKDAGTKATGSMTVKNEYDSSTHPLQAGTRFIAPDGKVFRSDSDVVVPGATPTIQNGKLGLAPGTVTVNVTSDQAGDTYNEGPARYTLPGLSTAEQAQIYGQGAQMAGGTTKTVTIVAQADVDTEQATLLAKDKDSSNRDLTGRVPSGYIALPSSQTALASAVSPSPAIGSEGDTGSLTLKVTYSVLAVKQSDYQALIHAQEQKQVGDTNQVYDDGLGAAQVSVAGDKDASGRQTFHFTTDAYGGSRLDKATIAAKLKGQRYGDAVNIASGLPGVTRAEVNISPAWASKIPSRTDKITITIQVAAAGK